MTPLVTLIYLADIVESGFNKIGYFQLLVQNNILPEFDIKISKGSSVTNMLGDLYYNKSGLFMATLEFYLFKLGQIPSSAPHSAS